MGSKLQQLFKANVKSGKGFEIKSADTEEATVYLYDAIGGWYGIDAQDFVKALAEITAKVIHLRINSPGGDVFDARAIKTALRQHAAKVIAHVDGLAASAATYIALGADEVEISQGGFFMIHNAWTLAMGNANELREVALLLDKVDASILNDYVAKTGLDAEQVKAWMDAETWFTADDAVEHGFVDRVYDGEAVDGKYNLDAYNNVPKALLSAKSTVAPSDDGVNKAADALRAKNERRLQIIELG